MSIIRLLLNLERRQSEQGSAELCFIEMELLLQVGYPGGPGSIAEAGDKEKYRVGNAHFSG